MENKTAEYALRIRNGELVNKTIGECENFIQQLTDDIASTLRAELKAKQEEIEGLREKQYVNNGMLKNALRDLDSFQIKHKNQAETIRNYQNVFDKYFDGYACSENMDEQIESQSARIKELVEGIKKIRNDPFQNELVIKHCDCLLTPHTEAKE